MSLKQIFKSWAVEYSFVDNEICIGLISDVIKDNLEYVTEYHHHDYALIGIFESREDAEKFGEKIRAVVSHFAERENQNAVEH
jgi:hypothetical protein